jgi:predicted esterase
MTEEQLCESRMKVANQFDFNSIECNGEILFKVPGGNTFYKLKEMDKPEDKEDEEREKKMEEFLKMEQEQLRQEKMRNNTQSYIDIICPNGLWENGKCLEVNK